MPLFLQELKNLAVNKKEVSPTPKMEEKTMQEAKVEEKPVEEVAPKAVETPAEEAKVEEDTKEEKKEDSVSKAVNDSEKNITDKSTKTDK